MERWRRGEFDLIVSPALLAEVMRALAYPKIRERVDAEEARTYVRALESGSVRVDDPTAVEPVSADPRDDYLVALARESGAHVLVSGDRHLTELKEIRPPVVLPREFLLRLDRL